MRRLAILLWGWATVGCGGNNSRFGDFYSRQGDKNSRQGLLREFSQRLDLARCFLCQTSTYRAKTKKFPVPRE